MPLDDLTGVIETLQQRIRQHGPTLRENETRTRTSLIDPLLQALGWDTADPALVTPEYAVGNSRADYALLDAGGKPAALVEAKRLGESLESHRMQMVNYANMSGIPYAGLTDGNHWELYEVFAQKPIEERRLLQVSIADSPAHRSALQLLLLWRPNLASGQPMPASAPILATPQPAPKPKLEPEPTPPGWTPLADYNPPSKTSPPSVIRFPDGNEQGVVKWYDLITSAISWLYANNRLTADKMPVYSSTHRYICNDEPIHSDGTPFNVHVEVPETPLVAQVHVSAKAARQHTRKLLQHCGVNPADVFVQTAP